MVHRDVYDMQAVSEYEANGMVVARRSHSLHQEVISNGTWGSYSASNSGQMRLLEFYKRIGETFPLLRARLEPGDVVLFSKGTFQPIKIKLTP